ncbi:MAG: hypothetical protein ACXVKH_14200, partial [Candidatus Angelobacter sp.]
WPRSKRFPRLAKLQVRFGDPIFPPDTMTNPEETYKQVTEELRGRVTGMWEQMREKTATVEGAVAGD